jgi:hypothetical protein
MGSYFDTIGWQPTIGDPSFMGWFTVFAYFITCIISAKVYLAGDYTFRRKRQHQKQLWLAITIIMLLLFINKQLDLQSLFTQIAKAVFKDLGLYEDRRHYQALFILGILFTGISLTAWLIYEYYLVIKNHLLALIGLGYLIIFVLIRAASFHHMDQLISTSILGMKLNWVFELTGIVFIFINGITLWRRGEQQTGQLPPR